MNWTEIIIETPSKNIEYAGNIANMVVPYGIYIEDYSNLEHEILEIAKIDLIDKELLDKDRSIGKIHVYISPESNPSEAISFISERLNCEKITHNINVATCNNEDWLNNWKKYFKPIKIGKKLLIRPIWEDNFDSDGRIVLNLEPGLAFGTGTHETTRLCLKILDQYIKPGMKVLDIGCGSGILGVASLLLGADSALGVDIDELAVKTSIENAKINNVDTKFNAICGNLTNKVSGTYDVIVANIVADIIIDLSSNVQNYMNNNSIFIVSGIIDTRKDDVRQALINNFNIIEEYSENGWIAFKTSLKS